jgi:hypothetical protein
MFAVYMACMPRTARATLVQLKYDGQVRHFDVWRDLI